MQYANTCFTCGTDNFEGGRFYDATTPAEKFGGHTDGSGRPLANLFCLGCAGKYEEQGIAEFYVLPSADQVATALEWEMQGIGIN